jgi:hypothetical protein
MRIEKGMMAQKLGKTATDDIISHSIIVHHALRPC